MDNLLSLTIPHHTIPYNTIQHHSRRFTIHHHHKDAYTERGLGTVHLKVTEDRKVQVVVRAETSLGNILLNVLVSEVLKIVLIAIKPLPQGVPVERVGKNNVMLICLPNPPIDPKAEPEPVTFLIRSAGGPLGTSVEP